MRLRWNPRCRSVVRHRCRRLGDGMSGRRRRRRTADTQRSNTSRSPKEWIDAFTKETGIKVTYRQGGDTELSNQLDRRGRLLAGRCVPHRELTGDGRGRGRWGVRRCRHRDRRAGARQVPPVDQQVDRRRGPHRLRLQHAEAAAGRVAAIDHGPAAARMEGALGHPPPKADFQAIVSAMLQLTGEQATSAWLTRMKTNATLPAGQYRHPARGQRR